MLVYPQMAQFPITKRRRVRTVVNRAADSRTVTLADPAGAVTEWRLEYSGLTDAEAGILREFFETVEGTLQDFTFLDPTSNLLAWSEDLDEAVWTRGPLLTITSGISDPIGGTRASRLTNSGGGAQSIFQILPVPGVRPYCLSTYVRSAASVTVSLLLGTERADRLVANEWTRITFTGTSEGSFGLEIPAGSQVEVFGLQVEAQPAPSVYKASTTGGVFEEARLRDDALAMTATGVGLHSCTINIIHANHF